MNIPKTTVDTDTLAKIIDSCFDNSMDGRFSEPDQDGFLKQGTLLRAQFAKLLSIEFDAGTPALLKANDDLSAVNDRLEDDADVLANTAAVITEISTLVQSLDNLLTAATGFL